MPAVSLPPHPVLENFYPDSDRRADFVNGLFAATASEYDRINAMAFCGSGNWYRHRALKRAGLRPGMRVLDVASGTGAVARAASRIVNPQHLVCCDPCARMLAVAAGQIRQANFVQSGAESLPFESGRFDFLSMGYALRHVADLSNTFAEYHRVLATGGRLLILEVTKPRGRLAYAIARSYFRDVIPFLTRLTTCDRKAAQLMRYFWETIDSCVPPQTIISLLKQAGFTSVRRRVDLGVFSEYTAVKPAV